RRAAQHRLLPRSAARLLVRPAGLDRDLRDPDLRLRQVDGSARQEVRHRGVRAGGAPLMSSTQLWTLIFVGLSFSFYLCIAYRSLVSDTAGFYVAGGGIPAPANGAAIAADWMSAASFISMAGLIALAYNGYSGAAYLMGWTGGYVLLALLLAPYLRKFGKFTIPDFVGDRYNESARLLAVVCAVVVSLTYVVGQMAGVGVVFSRFLSVDTSVGVLIGMAIVFFYAVLGGMKGITWTQVCQYSVLIVAYLIPAVAVSTKITGIPMPQIGF